MRPPPSVCNPGIECKIFSVAECLHFSAFHYATTRGGCGVGVIGGTARRLSSEAEMYGYKYARIMPVSALGSSEASAPEWFICISIMGSSNRTMQLFTLGAVSSLGRVCFQRLHCNCICVVLFVPQEADLP